MGPRMGIKTKTPGQESHTPCAIGTGAVTGNHPPGAPTEEKGCELIFFRCFYFWCETTSAMKPGTDRPIRSSRGLLRCGVCGAAIIFACGFILLVFEMQVVIGRRRRAAMGPNPRRKGWKRSFICDQKHASVYKLTRRSPNAI
jgi:hypothetical protein